MDFKNYKFKFRELSKYEGEIRRNIDISDYERVCRFLTIIDGSLDYTLLSEKQLLDLLIDLSDENKYMSSDINSFGDFIESLNGMLDRYTAELRTAFRPMIESLSRINFGATADIISNTMKEFSKRIQEIIKPEVFKGIDFKAYFEWVDDYVIVASEYEWVVYDDMDFSDLRRIVDIHNNNEYNPNQKEQLINELYLSYLTYEVVDSIFIKLINSKRSIIERIVT